MIGVRFVGAVLFALCGAASALDLSGKVLNLDSTGRGGVVVSLSGSGRSTVTENDGTWAILEPTNIKARSSGDVRVTSNLRMHAGRLRVDFAGRDLLGRFGRERELFTEIRPELAARSLAPVKDTLVYSLEGRIFLRDTVGASRAGMVRFYDTTWNADIVYGYLTDDRDGQTYRAVEVNRNTGVWMAQNLSFAGAGMCVNGNVDSCSKYGRHYRWEEVMQGAPSSRKFPSGVKGICPTGWHVPSVMEWRTLETNADVGGDSSGPKLKSARGWNLPYVNGSDVHGFRALPSGSYYPGMPNSIGRFGRWWTSTETNQNGANARDIGRSVVDVSYLSKDEAVPLRCVKDFR